MAGHPRQQGPNYRRHLHNMHLGDAWEWADDPNYPETFASMAFRVGLDYILYGMTH